MKTLKQITLVSVAALALVGCNDSYNESDEKDQLENISNSILTASNRNVAFLVDTDGKSLYTFDVDTLNKSNCLPGTCQDNWPLFVGIDNNDTDIKAVPGSEGHLAYRMHPLYYFLGDEESGDVNGNNKMNVWHLVHAPEAPADRQVKLSETRIKQTFLTDKDQRALYVFDKDGANVSNCYDTTPTSGEGCESVWPVFYSADLGTLPEGVSASDFTVINRDVNRSKEGEPTQQLAYKGKPLYYFTPDNKEALSTKGDWFKGVWHLVELNAEKIEVPLDTTAGEKIYTNCASCHLENGLGTPGGAVKIGEIGDAETIEGLLNYMKNDGTGKNSIMVGIAKGLSEQQIIDVSAYIATLKK